MTGAPFYGLAASSRFDEGKSPDTWKIEVHPYRDLIPSGVAPAESSRGGLLQAGFKCEYSVLSQGGNHFDGKKVRLLFSCLVKMT